jgi:hypothetical protein
MKQKIKKILAKVGLVAIAGVLVFQGIPVTQAASVTSLSDVMSRLKASTASNHEIKFVTPTGVTADAQTIILTFSADFTNVTNIVHTDIDFAEGDTGNCSTASFTEKTLGASPSGATWGADGDSATTVTITAGTGRVTAGRCVRIKIGTNAVSQATGTNQISNGAIDDDDTISISGSFGDTGTLSVDIITDDQVNVTATVDPTITFSISDTTIGFGSLSSTAARWATGDTNGSASDSAAAHTMSVATNAASGYVLSYNGATLTSGGNTIDVGAITNDADGTQSTEEFAVGYSTNGSSTIASGYDHNSTPGNRDWAFVAGTTTTLASRTSPTNTETISAFYLRISYYRLYK